MRLPWQKTVPAQSEVERIPPTVELPAVSNATGLKLTDIEELSAAFGIVNSLAGPVVNERTAMKVSVVYACTRLIAGAIAGLPATVYRETGNGREKDGGHPLSPLLNLQPTPTYSAALFWEFVTTSMLLRSAGYAVILRDGLGAPVELLPLPYSKVIVESKAGRLLYAVELDGVWRGFDQDDILHFPGFGFDGVRSLSVIQHGALNSVGLAIAMEQYSSEFFKNGAHQDVAIIKNSKWDPEDMENFRTAYHQTYGGIGKGKYPLTVSKGFDIKELSVNAEDAQLLESRKFQITDIARAFGLPGFMVNDTEKNTSWGTGIAETGLAFIRYTLAPHLQRFEQELNRKLFMRTPWFMEFNTAGLMRGTTKERYDAYKIALGGSNVPGWTAVNEVRRVENLPPVDDPAYDKPYMPPQGAISTINTGGNGNAQ